MASPAPQSPPPHHQSASPKQQYYYFIIIALVLVAVVLIFTNAFAVGFCTWAHRIYTRRAPPRLPDELRRNNVRSWVPSHKYKKDEEEADAECAVCLTEFDEGEEVRQLPQCGHSFHAACIDMWFHSHSSCPVCRSIVLPSPSHSMDTTPHQLSQTNLLAGMDSLTIRFA